MTTRFPDIPRLFALLALVCAIAGSVRADPGARDYLRALARVPSDAHLCFAMPDGAALRASVPGRYVEDVLAQLRATQAGDDADVTPWRRLATTLGLDHDEAFDRLLGGSVVFVMRRDDDAGELGWALRATVSRSTLAKLRDAVEPAPRGLSDGRPVFALEDGRFLMAVERVGEGKAIVLAPAHARALLDAMVRNDDDTNARGLVASGVFHAGDDTLHRHDALFHVDVGAMLPPEVRRGERTDVSVSLLARVREADVSMTATLRAPELAGPRDVPFRPWPMRWFSELNDPDAAVVILDRTNNEILEMLLGSAERGTPGLLPWRLPPEVSALCAHRAAMVIRTNDAGELEGAIAMETDDVRTLADAVDGAMPSLIGDDGRTFLGLPAAAVRTAPLPALAMLRDDAPATLAWNYRVAGDCTDDQETGWWTVGVGPATVSHLGRTLALDPMRDERAGADLAWISVGVVRPAMLVGSLARMGLATGPGVAMVARIDELNWSEVRTGTDTAIAAMTLRLNERAPEPPGLPMPFLTDGAPGEGEREGDERALPVADDRPHPRR